MLKWNFYINRSFYPVTKLVSYHDGDEVEDDEDDAESHDVNDPMVSGTTSSAVGNIDVVSII